MARFRDFLEKGWEYAKQVIILWLIPLVATFLSIGNILTVMQFYGLHVGVKLSFPVAIIDLWNFVSTPSSEGGAPTSLAPTSNIISFAVYSIALILIQSALAAGYLGSLSEYVDEEEFHFTENGGNYLREFLLYYLLLWVLFHLESLLAFFPLYLGASSIPFFLLIPFVLFVSYLLYGIPFLIVTTDQGFSYCLNRSIYLAVNEAWGKKGYCQYGLKYLGFTALISVPMTILTVNLNILGIIFGGLLVMPLALTLNTGTLLFFKELHEE